MAGKKLLKQATNSRDMPWPHFLPSATAAALLLGLDQYHLAAFEQLTATCKSVVIAAALLHGHITAKVRVSLNLIFARCLCALIAPGVTAGLRI
jgi:hypothetical protein